MREMLHSYLINMVHEFRMVGMYMIIHCTAISYTKPSVKSKKGQLTA